MSPGKLTVRAGVAALFTIIWAVVLMLAPPKYPFPHRFNHDIDAPVLAMELSRGPDDLDRILRPGATPQAEVGECYLGAEVHDKTAQVCEAQARQFEYVSNELDLVFIPLYAFSLWTLARIFANRVALITLLITGTVLCDYLEDWQIFRALKGESSASYVPSLIKWALFGLVLIGTGIILLRSKNLVYSLPTKRLLSIAYFASGLLYVVSVAFGAWIGYSLIDLATGVFGFLLVVHVIGFLGPYLAVPEIKLTFVDNFCEVRKTAGRESLIAVKAEPSDGSSAEIPANR